MWLGRKKINISAYSSTAPDPQGLSYSLSGFLCSPNAMITNTNIFSSVFALQNANLDCVVSGVFFSI